jgi:hypothetical protein
MTIAEATEIIRLIGIAFPVIDDWLRKRTKEQPAKAAATAADWREMLTTTSYDHALEAIRRMKMGEAEPPVKPWDIACLPLWIRAVAGRVAAEEAKERAKGRLEQLTRERHRPKGHDNLADLMRISFCNGEAFKEGRIDKDTFRANKADLVRQSLNWEEPAFVPASLREIFPRYMAKVKGQ